MESKNDNAFLIRSIGYFTVLAHNLSYTETAAQLGISQPALTQQIKKLEKKIGASLFYIDGKQIHLTSSGEIFLKATQKVNNVYADASDEIKQANQDPHNVVNIGIISAMPNNVLVDFIVKFKEKYPCVDFNVKSVMRHSLRSQLGSDSVDILVLYLPDNSFMGLNNYKTTRICSTEVLLVSPFKIKDGDKVTLSETHNYKWVGYPEGYYIDRIIAEHCHNQNVFVPKYSAHFSQVDNILNFSKKTGSLAAIPGVCLPFVKNESFIYKFSPTIKFDITIVYRNSKIKVPVINEFLNELDLYLQEKDYLTRLRELVKEEN